MIITIVITIVMLTGNDYVAEMGNLQRHRRARVSAQRERTRDSSRSRRARWRTSARITDTTRASDRLTVRRLALSVQVSCIAWLGQIYLLFSFAASSEDNHSGVLPARDISECGRLRYDLCLAMIFLPPHSCCYSVSHWAGHLQRAVWTARRARNQ